MSEEQDGMLGEDTDQDLDGVPGEEDEQTDLDPIETGDDEEGDLL